MQELGLTNSVAGMCIAVARKAARLPDLQSAIVEGRMSVSLASRIVSCLTPENVTNVIAFALSHTCREVDFECARINPKPDAGDGAKPTGDRRIRVTVTVSRDTYDKLRRVESLEAQCGRGVGLERALEASVEEYLFRRDPVRKAKRRKEKMPSTEAPASAKPCTYSVKQNSVKLGLDRPHSARVPLTAAQRHAVHDRDGGRCAHVGESGRRCGSDRFIDVHHVHPVSRGGGNKPENLTTLCSFHHDLIHQTSFPIDGQVSWIRAREVAYTA